MWAADEPIFFLRFCADRLLGTRAVPSCSFGGGVALDLHTRPTPPVQRPMGATAKRGTGSRGRAIGQWTPAAADESKAQRRHPPPPPECAPGQWHGQQPVSGTADPRSSQTGQVIRGFC